MSQALNIEKANLDKFLNSFLSVDEAINDNLELLDIAVEESDENSIHEINEETKVLITSVEDLEFNRMFSNKMDPNSWEFSESSTLSERNPLSVWCKANLT